MTEDVAGGNSADPEEAAVRRPTHLVVWLEPRSVVDLDHVLQGSIVLDVEQRLFAHCPPATMAAPISSEELVILAATSATAWTPLAQLVEGSKSEMAAVDGLLRRGLLLSDQSEQELVSRRECDEKLAALRWDTHAAAYHYRSKWRDVAISGEQNRRSTEDAARWEESCKPPAFYKVPRPLDSIKLPDGARGGALYDLLLDRKTTRHFRSSRPLKLEALASVLRYTFGCHGHRSTGSLRILKKTSPSGGGLHSVEAYPLICNVEGLRSGIYHYDVEGHSLELMTAMAVHEARALAASFTAGQVWFSAAQALVVMAARFERSFWKYPQHSKVYKVILMDAAHLSQTFYLVCAELALGAFFTAAVNDCNIEEALGLDTARHGVVGILGCGHAATDQPLGLCTETYQPRA